MRRVTAALLVGGAFAVLSAKSRADGTSFEIAGKAGYLSNLSTLGVGGRLGYSFSGFYAGLSLVDYLPIQSGLYNGITAEVEVGYGLTVSFFTVRPLVGIGAGFTDSPPCGPSPPQYMQVCGGSGNAFVVQPGGVLQFQFGHVIFGVAPSALVSVGTVVQKGFEVDGQVGVRF